MSSQNPDTDAPRNISTQNPDIKNTAGNVTVTYNNLVATGDRAFKRVSTKTQHVSELSPSQLIRASTGVVPYLDRGRMVNKLLATAKDALEVVVVGGAGGTGKTRLAYEVHKQATTIDIDAGDSTEDQTRWDAHFINETATPASLAQALQSDHPLVLILDYAETQRKLVGDLICECDYASSDDKPIRLVLLVRQPANLHTTTDEHEAWVDAVRPYNDDTADYHLSRARVHVLDNHPLTANERTELYRSAVDKYIKVPGARTDVVDKAPEYLSNDEYSQPLAIVLAAYLATRPSEKPDQKQPDTLKDLFKNLLKHEEKHWEGRFQNHGGSDGLHAAVSDKQVTAFKEAAAMATVTEATSRPTSLRLLALTSSVQQQVWTADEALSWLKQSAGRFLPPEEDPYINSTNTAEGQLWQALEPDKFGEFVVATAFSKHPAVVRSLLDSKMDTAGLSRALLVLSRACADYVGLASTVTEAIGESEFVALVKDVCGRINRPTNYDKTLDSLATNLSLFIPTAGPLLQVRPAQNTTMPSDEAAHSARGDIYIRARSEAGDATYRSAAVHLALSKLTLDVFTHLAGIDRNTYTPDLAVSLNNHALRLAENGQRHEALTPSAEAVTLRRELAGTNPAAYTPNLAASLNNHATLLAENGQRHEALTPSAEAVTLRRELTRTNPAAYTPDLAMSLNNHANRLAENGQRHEALTPSAEAVTLYQELARTNPAVYTPNLAASLNNHATRLAENGQRHEALTTSAEAVALYQDLAHANPAAYNPDLAASLVVRVALLADNGHRKDAFGLLPELKSVRRWLLDAGTEKHDLVEALGQIIAWIETHCSD